MSGVRCDSKRRETRDTEWGSGYATPPHVTTGIFNADVFDEDSFLSLHGLSRIHPGAYSTPVIELVDSESGSDGDGEEPSLPLLTTLKRGKKIVTLRCRHHVQTVSSLMTMMTSLL